MTAISLSNPHSPLPPTGYIEFLEGIKKRIQEAQLRAGLSVNTDENAYIEQELERGLVDQES
jgi:hypothetical protein